VSLGLYGAWNGNDGQYVDVIMKRSKLDNEYNLNGNVFIGQIEADYETWATSVSAEYGKRFETKKGFYVEPNAELTLGRVEGESYNTSLSLGGERLNVQQDDYDTLVGRLGLRIGQKLDKASYYAKFAVAKEFAGDFDTKYSTIGKSGAVETKETSMSFKDTWYEMQIGGTAQLSDNSYVYASYERNFGADVEQKWRIDAGLRFSF
jgi:outer membrane autotransporter protein